MLTDEQLVARAKTGDDLAFAALALRYSRLTESYARRRFAPELQQQDLDQEAVIGLWAAVRSYDVTLGVPFYALAHLAVARWLDTVVKTALAGKRRVLSDAISLDTTEHGEFGDEPFYVAVEDLRAVDPAVALERKSDLETIVRVVTEELSPRQHAVVVGQLNGETYVETAKRLGLKYHDDYTHGQERSKAVDNALQLARGKILRALKDAA